MDFAAKKTHHIFADLALLLLKEGAKQAGAGAGGAAFSELVSFLTGDNSSEVKAGLDQINSHLDEITKMVESIPFIQDGYGPHHVIRRGQVIYNFYNTDSSTPLNFAEILQKEEFNYDLDPNMHHIMPLSNGSRHVWDGDESAYRYYMDFNEAGHSNGTQFRQHNFRVTMLYITTALRKSYYKLDDVIFFRPDMVKRYSDMYPEI